MTYMPSIFGENMMDDFFDHFDDEFFGRRNPLLGKHAKNVMKTDIREKDGHYELDIDLPGFKKDEVSLSLQNGYLTVSANKGLDKDEKDKNGKMLRQERYAGSMARSFYVGEEVENEDVKAKFENGVLCITLPKQEDKKKLPKKQQIAIEG